MFLMVTYPAKNINRNHDPGTANNNIASSVFLSSANRQGMQANIKRFETKNMVFGGEFDCKLNIV